MQALNNHIHEIAAGTCFSSIFAGISIGQVNLYLQAGVYLVGIISGCFATYFYWKKARAN